MTLKQQLIPTPSVFSYNGPVNDLKRGNVRLKYLGPDFIFENNRYKRTYPDKYVTPDEMVMVTRNNFEMGVSAIPEGYIVCQDYEGYLFVDGPALSTNLLDLRIIEECPWIDIEFAVQIRQFLTSEQFQNLLRCEETYFKLTGRKQRIEYLNKLEDEYRSNQVFQLIVRSKRVSLDNVSKTDLMIDDQFETLRNLIYNRYTRSILLYLAKKYRDFTDSIFHGLDITVEKVLRPVNRIYTNVFSYNGKVKHLLHDKYNSYLVYHGPSYKGSTLHYSPKTILYEEIEEIMRENFELLGDNGPGILIAQDFEGEFFFENDEVLLGIDLLSHKTEDPKVGGFDDLDGRARSALIQFSETGYDFGAEDAIVMIEEILETYNLPAFIQAQLLLNKAENLQLLGRHQDSLSLLDDIASLVNKIDTKEHRLPLDHLDYNIPRRTKVLQMVNEYMSDNLSSARKLAQEIIETGNGGESTEHDVLVTAYNAMGLYEMQHHNFVICLEYFEEALYHSEFVDQKKSFFILMNISNVHMKLEQFDIAYEYLIEAKEIVNKHYSAESQETVMMEETMGRYFIHFDLDKARKYFKRALVIANRIGISPTYEERILNHLIIIESLTENYYKVEDYYNQFLELIDGTDVGFFDQDREFLEAMLSAQGILPEREDAYRTLFDMAMSDEYLITPRVQAATFFLRFLSEDESQVVDELGMDREQILDKLHSFAVKYHLRSITELLEKEMPLEEREEIDYIVQSQISIVQMRDSADK